MAGPSSLVLVLLIGGVAFYLLVYLPKRNSYSVGSRNGRAIIPTTKVMTLRSSQSHSREALRRQENLVVNDAFSIPSSLGRPRNVVVDNAFSIPFDDAGDAANADDAVVAAAALAAGYVLVVGDDKGVATVSAGNGEDVDYAMPDPAAKHALPTTASGATPLAEYEQPKPTDSLNVVDADPFVDAASHIYQNEDSRPWDGEEMQDGSHDYENSRNKPSDEEEQDGAHDYVNSRNRPWDGEEMQDGAHDYENARSTSIKCITLILLPGCPRKIPHTQQAPFYVP